MTKSLRDGASGVAQYGFFDEPVGSTSRRGEMATNFHQLFGTFSGELATATGQRVVVRNIPGFAETQYVRW